MHDSVLEWVAKVLTDEDVAERDVLEVGSYDVNGSIRPTIMALAPKSYIGVDQEAGPSVDEICGATDLPTRFGRNAFDVVISVEMLEHVRHWEPVVKAMVDVLKPEGLLVLTTRSPGFPYHPYPIDTWRYTIKTMGEILAASGLVVREIVDDPQVPGVFAIATKPTGWRPPWPKEQFVGIEVEAMVGPDGAS